MAQEHADSLWVGGELETWVHRRLIVELAEKRIWHTPEHRLAGSNLGPHWGRHGHDPGMSGGVIEAWRAVA
jgi:hypothetical protein